MDFTLRQWKREDAPELALALNNPKIHQNLRDGLPSPYTTADALSYIDSMLSAPPDSVYAYAIEVEGRAAGSLGLFRQDNIHRYTAELGYCLSEEYWGRGIMSGAVAEACRKMWVETDLMRIFAQPFAHNKGSCRVLEKAGFSHEGTLRCNGVKNGQVIDMEMYALVKQSPQL